MIQVCWGWDFSKPMFIFLVDIEEEFFIAKDEYEWTFMSGKKKKKNSTNPLYQVCRTIDVFSKYN